MAGTHLVVTVGTNPLPVVVATNRLLQIYPKSALTMVVSPETEEQARAIFACLRKRLGLGRDPDNWQTCKVEDASSPKSVHEALDYFVRDCEEPTIHLHYTGGAKTMGVQAIKAFLHPTAGKKVEDSYLDPRDREIVDGQGSVLTPMAIRDERREWDLTIVELAKLHGFTTSFQGIGGLAFHRTAERTATTHPNPAPVREALVEIATNRMLPTLTRQPFGPAYARDVGKDWDPPRHLKLPDPNASPLAGRRFPALCAEGQQPPESWQGVPSSLNLAFGKRCWQDDAAGWIFHPEVLTPAELEELCKFMRSGWVELAAYDSLRTAAERFEIRKDTLTSTHFARVQRKLRSGQFEIDVLAVFGYELLAVSCTASSASKEVKGKAFEVLHRARQIGGDGARCIVLSMLHGAEAQRMEDEFHDDIGSGEGDRPLVIWGTNKAARLIDAFESYLRDQLRLPFRGVTAGGA